MPENNQNTKNLPEKLIEIYEEVDHIEKRGDNQKYKYVKATDVAHPIRKALRARGVYVEVRFRHVRSYEVPIKSGGTHQAVDLECMATFVDTKTKERLEINSFGTGTDGGDKAIYKAMTGALKYALRNAFLLPDESDPEAEDENDPTPAVAQRSVSAKIIPFPTEVSEVSAVPNQEQLNKYYEKLTKTVHSLSAAGMKASSGVPLKQKIATYIKKLSNPDLTKISIAQWESIFSEIDSRINDPEKVKELIQIIEERIEVKEAA